MIQTGQILNDTYEVLESLGSGTGGIIFKAYHKRMKKYVAIKLIKNELRDKTDIRLEIDVLKNLKHEFLPQVIDFFEAENDVYTVMEFIEGKNFKQLVKEGHTFTEEQVRKYGMQLCSAVEYLHSQNPPIIHSDIKPANIMLTPQDNICLIDFNISTVSNDGTAVSKGGSSGFAAPEQFRRIIDVPVVQDDFHEETRFIGVETDISTSNPASNIAFIDLRTDIYGVGASLYYILTQRSPVDGKMDFRGIDCTSELKSVLLNATNPIPQKRYRNISECKSALSKKNDKSFWIKFVAGAAVIIFVLTIGILLGSNNKDDISSEATAHIESVSETTDTIATIATATFSPETTETTAPETQVSEKKPEMSATPVREGITVTTPPPVTETTTVTTTVATTSATKTTTTTTPATTTVPETTTKPKKTTTATSKSTEVVASKKVQLDSVYPGIWSASSAIPKSAFEEIGGDVKVVLHFEPIEHDIEAHSFCFKPMDMSVSWDSIADSLIIDSAYIDGSGFFMLYYGQTSVEFIVPEEVWKSFAVVTENTAATGLSFQVGTVHIKSADLYAVESTQD